MRTHVEVPDEDWHLFTDRTLRRTRQNEIGEFVVRLGLRPDDFHWRIMESKDSSDDGTVSAVEHLPTGSCFVFDYEGKFLSEGSDRRYHLFFSPGVEHEIEEGWVDGWNTVARYVANWLARVKTEHEAPDFCQKSERKRHCCPQRRMSTTRHSQKKSKSDLANSLVKSGRTCSGP